MVYDAQMAARARGEALPWDKKLTRANSKFTACIFIFLIPAPSARHWAHVAILPPLVLHIHFLLFIFFISHSPAPQAA